MKEKLSPGFNDMLLQSKRRLERDLKRFGEDKIDPAEAEVDWQLSGQRTPDQRL